MNLDFSKITIWWSCIGLKIKRRKRGTRGGLKDNNIPKNKLIRNAYHFPSILSNNACSLNSEKLDMLFCLSEKYDVLAITETWCNDQNNICLNNFDVYSCNRLSKGGGSAIYVRSSIQSTSFRNFIHNNSNEYEITCVIIRPDYLPRIVSVFVIVCVYIPPSSTKGPSKVSQVC